MRSRLSGRGRRRGDGLADAGHREVKRPGGVNEFNVSVLDLNTLLLGNKWILVPVPLWMYSERIICPKSLSKLMIKLEIEIRSPYVQLSTLLFNPKIHMEEERLVNRGNSDSLAEGVGRNREVF